MKEITERLHEKRQIELAKSILESNGYRVEKLEESDQTRHYNPKDYNIERIRKYNVTSRVQDWYDFLVQSGMIDNEIDPMLYAIEFAYREHNRYGSVKLPNIEGNGFSGYSYYFLLPPYHDSNPYDPDYTAEKKEAYAKEMLSHLISTIKKDTLMKWSK